MGTGDGTPLPEVNANHSGIKLINLLVDINVVLDLLEKREGYAAAAKLIGMIEVGTVKGFLSASSIDSLHYLIARQHGKETAWQTLCDLRKVFGILPTNQGIVDAALAARWPDFEDALVHETARQAEMDCILTSNLPDFKQSTLAVWSPKDFVQARASEFS